MKLKMEYRQNIELEADSCICRWGNNDELGYTHTLANKIQVGCKKCGFMTQFCDSPKEAIEMWNKIQRFLKGEE